jgi:hypothetical protein
VVKIQPKQYFNPESENYKEMARDAPITHTPDTNKEVPLLTD